MNVATAIQAAAIAFALVAAALWFWSAMVPVPKFDWRGVSSPPGALESYEYPMYVGDVPSDLKAVSTALSSQSKFSRWAAASAGCAALCQALIVAAAL